MDIASKAYPGLERLPAAANAAAPLKALAFAVSIGIAALHVYLVWVGYTESDDLYYAEGAAGWLKGSWFLGKTHWELRHCIVLPMAALFALFGQSEAALLSVSLAYYAAMTALLAYIAWQLHGWLAGALAIAIAGALPVVATAASLVSTDLPEATFIIASLWLFYRGTQAFRPALLVLSGVCAGVAVITRETSVALLAFYAVLFVAGYGGSRLAYPCMALGAALVVGLDWAYLTSLSGDPLYRLHVALAGAQGDGPSMAREVAKAPGLDQFGSLDVVRWLKPFTALLLNQNFGLFFWLAVPAGAWLASRGPVRARPFGALMAGLVAAWVVVLGYLLLPWLWVIPRYYAVCVILAVPLAIALACGLQARRPWAACAVLAALAGSSLALCLGANTTQMAGERALTQFARTAPGAIRTDPATDKGARWLLQQDGTDGKVSAGLPQAGTLFLYNSRPRRPLPAGWPVRGPQPDWTEVARFDAPPKWTQPLVPMLGLGRFLPQGLLEKLAPPAHQIRVYQIPA